ncbi:hypothetical protein CsSME_00011188 [Camellia sinensis var. sinensis]
MKRSPSSCWSSSSTSSVESDLHPAHPDDDQSAQPKPKPKRLRSRPRGAINKNLNQSKSQKIINPNSPRRSTIYRGVTRHRWTGRFEELICGIRVHGIAFKTRKEDKGNMIMRKQLLILTILWPLSIGGPILH